MTPIEPIAKVEINNTEISKDFLEDKFSRLDVKATTNSGELINIEIQVKNEYNMIKRSLYYWSKLYEEQLLEGDKYEQLSRTVCINILDFKYLDNDRFHNGYRLKEMETNEELTDIQEIHFIEIPKLKDLEDETNIETIDMLTAWTEFLKDPDSQVVRKLEFSNDEIKEAKDELYRLSRDSKEREFYYIREKSFLDKISALATAEEKGKLEGKLQGIKEEKINTASKLLKIDLDIESISSVTGLSKDEIIKLKELKE